MGCSLPLLGVLAGNCRQVLLIGRNLPGVPDAGRPQGRQAELCCRIWGTKCSLMLGCAFRGVGEQGQGP